MLQGQNSKLKTVEHYILQNIFQETPVAQFWTASHKVLKKEFVLKKTKFLPSSPTQGKNTIQTLNYELAKLETALLNTIKIDGTPKCHKLIRTTSTTYIVYNAFPGRPLCDYFSGKKLKSQQVVLLMEIIAQQLSKFQALNVVFFTLASWNIYISEGKEVFFADWSLARTSNQLQEKSILKLFDSVPEYALGTGQASWKVDVFSLGKVFQEVINQTRGWLSEALYNRLQLMVNSMTTEDQSQTIQISKVLDILSEISSGLSQTASFPRKSLVNKNQVKRVEQSKVSISDLKRITSANVLYGKGENLTSTSTSRLTKKNQTQVEQKSTVQVALSTVRFKNKSRVEDRGDMLARRMMAKRREVSFLIQLIFYFEPISMDISLYLLRFVQTAVGETEDICESFKQESIVAATRVNLILKLEVKRVWSILNWLKANHSKFNVEFQIVNLKEQVNIEDFHAKIKELAKSELGKPMSSSQIAQKTQFFYQLYLVSRSIEFGSLSAYWQKIESSRDGGQAYFSTERKLGMRYFKKKIEEAISKI